MKYTLFRPMLNWLVIGLALSLLEYFGYLVNGSMVPGSQKSPGSCTFPQSWSGSWYQSEVGTSLINQTSFLDKGVCVWNYGEFYVIENKKDLCFRCLLIIQRHKNVIQYKEGFCISTREILEVCSNLPADVYMFTVIAARPVLVPCPFQSNYSVDYSANSAGFCLNESISVMNRMQDVFYLQLNHCNPATLWHRQDFVVQCIGDWKDGNQNLLIAKFISVSGRSVSEYFHCVKYFMDYGGNGTMSLSRDANCWTVISPTEGPIQLILTVNKQETAAVPFKCKFPTWLRYQNWTSVSYNTSVLFYEHNINVRTNDGYITSYVTVPDDTWFRCDAITQTDTVIIAALRRNGNTSDPQYCLQGNAQGMLFWPVDSSPTSQHFDSIHQCHRYPRINQIQVLILSQTSFQDSTLPCALSGSFHAQIPTSIHQQGACRLSVLTNCKYGHLEIANECGELTVQKAIYRCVQALSLQKINIQIVHHLQTNAVIFVVIEKTLDEVYQIFISHLQSAINNNNQRYQGIADFYQSDCPTGDDLTTETSTRQSSPIVSTSISTLDITKRVHFTIQSLSSSNSTKRLVSLYLLIYCMTIFTNAVIDKCY